MLTGVRYDLPWRGGRDSTTLLIRDLVNRPGQREARGMTILVALFIIAALQGYNWSVNARVEAEYGVLKTRLEKLEEELRNGR